MHKRHLQKALIGALFLLILALSFLEQREHFSFDALKQIHQQLLLAFQQHPVAFIAVYSLLFISTTALALPTTGGFMLLAGAIFGFLPGTILAAICSTSGACISFVLSRYFFHDFFNDIVQQRAPKIIDSINQGISQEGAYYLFSIRMIASVPFFIVNLACGLSALSLKQFASASLASQCIFCSVFCYAGVKLASLQNWADFLNLGNLLTLAVLGSLPLLWHHYFNRRSKARQPKTE